MNNCVVAPLPSLKYRRYLLRRVVAVICQRLIRLGSWKIAVKRTVNARSLRFELRDHTQCLFFFGVSPEPENSALIRAIGEAAGGDLIDVGANFGQQPFEVWKSFRKIVLVEPNGEAARFLRDLFQNAFNVEILEAGASDRVGEATLFFPDEKQSGVARIGANSEGLKIALTTIDEILRTRALLPSLIKIDVEGFEEQVIRGAEETLKEHLPILAFECEDEKQFEKCKGLLPRSCDFYHIYSDVRPALHKSDQVGPVVRSLVVGSRTYVSKIDKISGYLSLIYAVPEERQEAFQKGLKALSASGVDFD
jgi:FkbM family methyltransferase